MSRSALLVVAFGAAGAPFLISPASAQLTIDNVNPTVTTVVGASAPSNTYTYAVVNNTGATVYYPITPYYPGPQIFTVSGAPSSLNPSISANLTVGFPASVSTLGAGTYTGTIDLGNAANLGAGLIAYRTVTLVINKGSTATGVTSSVNPSVFGQATTFNANVSVVAPAAGSASGTVTFDFGDGSSTSTVSVGTAFSGVTHTYAGVGSFTVTATYNGDANFLASSSTGTQVVNQAPQSLSFTSSAPAAVVGGTTYTPTATSTSGLPVSLTVDASSASVCAISGGAVRFLAVGTCIVDANQAGNANYLAASQLQQSFTVGKGSQTVSFTSTAPSNATVGGATYTPTATASSTLTVALTVDAASAAVCAISAGAVRFLAVGTCIVDANQAGNTNYNAATQLQQSFSVGKGAQTVSFTSTAPANATVAGATYTPTGTATSTLTVAFTVDAASSTVCAISGGAVRFIAVGTCIVDANQAGDTNYNAATQVQQSFSVGKGAQTVSFTSTAPANATVGGATYTPTGTATSTLTVAFTVDAASSAVCAISAGAVRFLAPGTCIVDANQAGDTNYNPATQVQQSFSVGKGAQTVSFTSTAPSNATVGGATYTPTATASSTLTVALTVDAASSAVCAISAGAVRFLAVGTCIVDANQAGDTNYNPATQVQQSFAVGKGAQTVSFTSTAPSNATVGGATYTPTATATSTLTVALTVDAASSAVCAISAGAVRFLAVGTCIVDANQAGDTNYNPATQVQQSFAVGKGAQTVSFTSTAPANATVGGATYTPTATATSTLTVALTVDAASSAVCAISAGAVRFLAVGTCIVDANQAGDTSYNAATQVQQSFAVGKGAQTVSFTSTAPSNALVGGPAYTPTATATSSLTVALTVDASSAAVCAISAGAVTFQSAGTCRIDANQGGNANYNAAPQVQQAFNVGIPTPAVTSINPASGVSTGGTTVTISGNNLTGATSVTIGGVSATGVSVVNATTITATTGAHAAGVVDVAVTTPGGTSVGAGLFTYVAAVPTVTAVNPNSGPVAGGTSVTITGTSFTGATAVKFGTANAASFAVASATSIIATSPAGTAGVVDITVTTPAGTSATGAADRFTFVAPKYLLVSPATDMVTVGKFGGPFSPNSFQYQVSASNGAVGYSISGVPSWLDVSSSGGTATTSATTITFTVNATADSLARGSYGPVTIAFTNTDDGLGTQSRTATLNVATNIAHDFNADGKGDIFWREAGGSTQMWLMNAAAVTANISVGAVPTSWSLVGQRDFDGDGKSDLLWRDTGGNIVMWTMNGGSVLSNVSLGNLASTWDVAGTADFNGDGKGDILWRDGAGNVALWQMNGSTLSSVIGLGNVATSWSIVGTADFDGGGKSDILWRQVGGDVAIWLMNGGAVLSTVNLGNVPSHWSIVGTGDFDGDGKADILWRDWAGNVAIWLMNGTTRSSVISVGNIPLSWTISETGDFDGDGKSDILWRDTSGNISIWLMNGGAASSVLAVGNIPTNWTIQSRNAD